MAGRDVVAITAWLFSFPQLQGSHLQLLLFQCLDDQKLHKKTPSTQLNPAQKICKPLTLKQMKSPLKTEAETIQAWF